MVIPAVPCCAVIHVQNPEPHLQEWCHASTSFLLQSTCCWLDVLWQNSAFYLLIFAADSTLMQS